MYDFFRGAVAHIDNQGNCCLDVNGVGYLLRISKFTRQALPLDGSPALLHARLVVREGEMLLFGFYDAAERAAFDLLTGVQGVGPAMALTVLSTLGVNELRRALQTKDIAALKKVKGVGAKSAERMALELSDKVERIPTMAGEPDLTESEVPAAASMNEPSSEAHRALIALGFTAKESESALKSLADDPALQSSEDYVRAALAVLRL
jgi:Holliday junction DNA helicase RuvA